MRRRVLVFLAGIFFAISFPLYACALESQNETISLVVVGTVTFATEDSSKSMPLYAIMFGDTTKAERVSMTFARYFGPYSLNATLWVRPADKPPNTWKLAIYKRPKNLDEAERWLKNPETFYEESYGDKSLLPSPFRYLENSKLERFDFFILYFDGGMKAYIKAGVDEEEAEELFKAVLDANARH